jgi:2-polyprenyl-3-methyl-5-hydroxy-6-metoxy-1,4-benzoquinol methylase
MILKNSEYLNAHGPYDHGIWKQSKKNKNINLFHKRSEYLLKKISENLLKTFSRNELKNKTILDIGCYDGWIIYNLNKKFNFKKVVGIEPREKNIQKGIIARKFYEKKKSKIIFIKTDINNFHKKLNEKFDIVLCLGVLHHVSSTILSIKNICKISSDIIILDSMIINKPDKKYQKNILNLLNLKDIAYINKQDWAISAFKYETPYFDGSTSHEPIVNVPEERLIKMSLESFGAQVMQINKPDKLAYKKEFQKLRGVKETLIMARMSIKKEKWLDQAKIHEKIFCFELLPKDMMLALVSNSERLENFFPSKYNKKKINEIKYAIKNPTKNTSNKFLNKIVNNNSQKAIVVNIFRAKKDKQNIEIAKWFLVLREFKLAKLYLLKITQSQESDWRSFYRACFFLSVLAFFINNKKMLKHYSRLLKISQPHFPISIGKGISWLKEKSDSKDLS